MHSNKYKATFTRFNKLVAISVACRARIYVLPQKPAPAQPVRADMWLIYDERQLGGPSAGGGVIRTMLLFLVFEQLGTRDSAPLLSIF